MKRFFIPLVFAFLTCACSEPQSFQSDPFCISCIEQACNNAVVDDAFKAHLNALSDEDKAQMTALAEAVDGCFEHQPWLTQIADKAYQSYGYALYSTERPWHPVTSSRALDEVIQSTPNRPVALKYLMHYASQWKDKPWAAEKLAALREHPEEDDVFALLVQTANAEQLEQLAAMESNTARNTALIYRWKDLGEETQKRALSAWVSAKWVMQTSGSAQLPQYLALDWMKRPFPDGVPNFVAVLTVDSIKIQNNEVKRRDWLAKDAFKWQPMKEPNAFHARVDLSPWLNTADNYKISASATLEIWDPQTSDECLAHAETCQSSPVLSLPITYDKTYRVFVGVETGAPHRVKQDKDNALTTQAFSLNICSGETCVPLWKDGAKTKDRSTKLSVSQGSDFYLTAYSGNADIPIASRLMARAGEGAAWHEIATFFTYAPMAYDVPMRADIALEALCGKLGPCKLELQLKPSLRMARRDPRITNYWGSTLDLGFISFDMLNQTPQQLTN